MSNFQRWSVNNETLYSYFIQDTLSRLIKGSGFHQGYEIITDSDFHEIKRLSLMPYRSIDTKEQHSLNDHEFILLSENHYITLSYYEKKISNIPGNIPHAKDVRVTAPIIQEIENDSVIWQWDGTDFPELYATSVKSNTFTDTSIASDYLHVNAMAIDPKDNNLVISCHNSDQLLKLNRATCGIVWKLGGINSDFPLEKEQHFLRQHHISFTDNNQTLLLLDNGEVKERPYSRVLEYQLDEVNRKVKQFRAYNIPDKFIERRGSVQKFENTYFICGGTSNYILEIDYKTGKTLLRQDFVFAPYRALKY